MLIKFDKGECITSRGPNLDFHNFPKLIKRIHHVVIIGSVVEPADPNATRFIESNSNSYAYQTGVILFIVLCDSTGSPSKVRRLLLMLLSIVALVVLLVSGKNHSITPIRNLICSTFLVICLLLRVLGRKPVEEPFLTVSGLLSLTYFRIAFTIVVV